MMLFRAAQQKDLAGIHRLAINSGVGLTTLPKDNELLRRRLSWSIESFSKEITEPQDEYYIFILEDTTTEEVVGISAIEAVTGHTQPFYSYKVSKRTKICHALNIRTNYEVLSLVNDNHGRSELCTLFLDPNYRQNHNGPLLSRARLLFIAQQPQRFASTFIAEMRGITDSNGNSPFWESLGRHFFQMSFEEADRLTLSSTQFISDLMPRNPIYIKLLTPEAQHVIGKPHHSTLAAMAMLKREGFIYNNYIDIFDGGPTLEAQATRIHSIATSKLMVVQDISDAVSSREFIISNTSLNFRATISQVVFNPQKMTCILSKSAAEALQIQRGDKIRMVALKGNEHGNESDK